jgi:hypothetical protein
MGFRNTKDPAEFWQEYEAQIKEKVVAFVMGRYIRGRAGFDPPLWGLLIVTSKGFRFHHFPHESWIDALSRTTLGGEIPKEKTFFIPKERLIGVELRIEKSWWKKILFPRQPLLIVRYISSEGLEIDFIAETETKAKLLVTSIQGLLPS